MYRAFSKEYPVLAPDLNTDIGLVRQPGWLSHKSCNFSAYGLQNCDFHKEVVQKLKFPNNSIEVFPVSSATHQGTTVYAIWDTGASQTVITHRLMTHLNLIPIETKLVHGINSKQMVDVVAITIKLPNGLLIPDIREKTVGATSCVTIFISYF